MPQIALPGVLLLRLATAALALGLLWWLQSILVPIALAVLISFLLSPPVTWLQKRGMPRALAVALMLACTLGLGGSIGWTVGHQMNRLVDTFPQYQQRLDAKIEAMRPDGRGFLDKLQGIVARVSSQLDRAVAPPPGVRAPGAPAQPVVVVEDPGVFHMTAVWNAVAPLLRPLATASLTLVLVVFMLLRREDLRDRVIAVFGQARLVTTTRAFDDAGTRISRYLARQLLVNAGFGLLIALGLMLIGVPYAPLWGALAAVLRYVPYVGTLLSAIVPVGLSVIMDDGWQATLMVIALFAALDVVANMFVEPHVYGQGVGVSETGTLVMVAFWTWLWGPVGLILATPLTVCVVVLGKYVPSLRYISMLLGDRPALPPDVRFYQRLLADDVHEATLIATRAIDETSIGTMFDRLMRPALAYLARDVARRRLSSAEEQVALEVCGQVAHIVVGQTHGPAPALDEDDAPRRRAQAAQPPLLLVPARDATSTAAAMLFERYLAADPQRVALRVAITSAELLASEVLQRVASERPFAVVIGVVSEDALAHTRLLCRRLRDQRADHAVIVGLWFDAGDDESLRDRLFAAGADHVTSGFDDTRATVESLRQLLPPLPLAMPYVVRDASASSGLES